MACVGKGDPGVEGRDGVRYPEDAWVGELAHDAEMGGVASSAGKADSDND